MSALNKRTAYPFFIPAALIVISAWVVWQWPGLLKHMEAVKELEALMPIFPLLPYVLFAAGATFGWRLNHAGLILASLVLGLAYFVVSSTVHPGTEGQGSSESILEAARILLPLNLAAFSTLTRRRLLSAVGLVFIVLILLQAVALFFFSHTLASPLHPLIQEGKAPWPVLYRIVADFSTRAEAWLNREALWGAGRVSLPAIISLCGSLGFMALRFARNRDAVSAGFLGALVAAFLGFSGDPTGPASLIYFSAAAMILLVAAVDSFFSMAYMDDLTALPSRRSLNVELANLGKKYVIAMIDIDHFKKFNDRYGHKTGDQVLKMIAAKLRDLTGGAKVFRYGGEEFTAIFPRKTMEEALPHLEVFLRIVESSPFFLRGSERRVRKAQEKGPGSPKGPEKVKVTVSIGAAAPGQELATPEMVLKKADKALYKAKKAGRNRVAT